MRLAIADPPYPPNLLSTSHGGQPRASRWYSTRPGTRRPYGSRYRVADHHEDAEQYDDPATHRALLEHLVHNYDGWALASSWDGPHTVYAPLPRGTRVMIWHRTNAMPSGARIISRYETVMLYPPAARRAKAACLGVPDVLTTSVPASGFAGSKPPAWTRWVLDALGYDPDADTVDDLFPGSGAVGREVAQSIIPI